MAGTMLEQVAKTMQVDLEAYRKAQQKANLLEQIAKLGWQAFSLDACTSVQVTLELDENGEPSKMTVKWQDEIYPVSIADIVGNSGNSGNNAAGSNNPGRGNWKKLAEIAARYGITVSATQEKAIAWYLPDIVKKIVKNNPTAKNDPELRQLAQQWLQQSSAAKSRGYDSLEKMGL